MLKNRIYKSSGGVGSKSGRVVPKEIFFLPMITDHIVQNRVTVKGASGDSGAR
jgi:hypothetical protein